MLLNIDVGVMPIRSATHSHLESQGLAVPHLVEAVRGDDPQRKKFKVKTPNTTYHLEAGLKLSGVFRFVVRFVL